MPSSYTASARYVLEATGENNNTWGSVLNSGALILIDFNVNGWTTKALSGDYSLTTANGAADEARSAMLKFTGSGSFTVTIPSVSKAYDVWNACTGVLTISNGSASVTVQVGEAARVITDGSTGMKKVAATDFGGITLTSLGAPSSNTDAATKKYVDDSVFGIASGSLPGQAGNSGRFLTTDGSTASWGTPWTSPAITTPTITAPVITGGLTFTGSNKQNVQAVSTLDLDLSTSDFFTKSISSNSAFTFSNPTAGKAQAFALALTISSSAVPSWPAGVKWGGGANPSATLGNGTHILGFLTLDGGTTWEGFLGGRAFA